jgi:branched-chain amino acid transport system permease protein
MSAGRPHLYTRYEDDAAILPTPAKRFWLALALVALALLPLQLPRDLLILAATAFLAAIGALGLNLATGYAGQVSLGHAFFLGVGAYTAAALSGDPADERVLGLGLDMVIWLPAAGLLAALLGALVAPLAVRLQGLYLAFVTLGLVALGEHLFRNWDRLTGGVGVGRPAAVLRLGGFRFDRGGEIFGVAVSREQRTYYLALMLCVVMTLAAKNLARSRVGRAFAAVRDRDLAAEMMGVPLARTKLVAFAVSSFYAGVAGAVLYSVTGSVEPSGFNLFLSIHYIAMVLIGGAGTIAGSLMGAACVVLLPRLLDGVLTLTGAGGGFLGAAQLERLGFGVLIVAFLLFEPRGLFGIWVRLRDYWKSWPFSY